MAQREFMRLAIDAALKGIASGSGGPFGAVIVKDGTVLASACNTVLRDNVPTRHAEINAIERACELTESFDLSGCEIYSTTQPCPMCFSAVHWARLESLVWGTTIADVARLGFNEMPIDPLQMKTLGRSGVRVDGPFMRDDCLALLRHWEGLPQDQKITY